ncbi:Qat anti-phage system TatD family nuclease QatD [Thioclava sp. GXIMD2076]|uniref:Qat anti-phage system TatD family nuclease QatD n=1 Tax=Thioclava sp. GXIMD2076 TaxID=3131931 RepID=UPI0030CFD932
MIDFHCHLDLFPRPQAVTSQVEAARIYMLSVTTTPKAFAKTARLPAKASRIRTALGLHPQLAHERHQEVDLFCRLVSETRYVGEIGLDGGNEFARHIVLQKEVFNRLLRSCSDAGGKILSIHSRHASGEVLEALKQHPGCGTPVLHWFTGSIRDAERAVGMGAWFSVGLPMLRSKRAGSLLAKIPRERILTETDAPFASTKGDAYPHAALSSAVAELAKHWKCTPVDAQKTLAVNLRTMAEHGNTARALQRSHLV